MCGFEPELVCKIRYLNDGEMLNFILGDMSMPYDSMLYEEVVDRLAEVSGIDLSRAFFVDRDEIFGYDADESASEGCPNRTSFRVSIGALECDIDLVYAVKIHEYYCELSPLLSIDN